MEKDPSNNLVLIPSEPYKWRDQEYFEHIASVCVALGAYEGDKQTIHKTGEKRLAWAIRHSSNEFGASNEYYETLEEAIYDFIALNPKPEL